jgi:hypothetical protein
MEAFLSSISNEYGIAKETIIMPVLQYAENEGIAPEST